MLREWCLSLGMLCVLSLASSASAVDYAAQAELDAKQDRTVVAHEEPPPNQLVCDTTLRKVPDGSWVMLMLARGDHEPSPENRTGLVRSTDEGRTWSPLEEVDVGIPREGRTLANGPTELFVHDGRCRLFFSTHSNHWRNDWQSWFIISDDSCRTWSEPQPVPGRLRYRNFIRGAIVTHDGRIMAPFQHYLGPEYQWSQPILERRLNNTRNGVIISDDGGKTWTEHGDIRLTPEDDDHSWSEPSIVELPGNRIEMIIRYDEAGELYVAESTDGGKTWPEYASPSGIPNPGSKATMYSLGGESVALLHNPDPKRRKPLALWVSFDGMKTWPYRRVLVAESRDGPDKNLNYPDGFVSHDKQWLHFGYDDNRCRAVYYGAKLPPAPGN